MLQWVTCLARLETFDISDNNISMLPPKLVWNFFFVTIQRILCLYSVCISEIYVLFLAWALF